MQAFSVKVLHYIIDIVSGHRPALRAFGSTEAEVHTCITLAMSTRGAPQVPWQINGVVWED